MSENYIVINGKKAELTDEQLEKLGIKHEKNYYEKMFERERDSGYYVITSDGQLEKIHETFCNFDERKFANGNYCRDKEIMSQRALHETLNRLLWRSSVIAGELDNPWEGNNKHWQLTYSYGCKDYSTDYFVRNRNPVDIYFPTKETAEAAIENIIKPFMQEHPDFVW